MCSTTPRFSYKVSKLTVTGYERGSGTVCQRVGMARVGTWAGYSLVGTWEGYTGYYPATPLCSRRACSSEAGPGSPCIGAGVGGNMAGRTVGAAPRTHPSGARSGPCRSFPGTGLRFRPSRLIGSRFRLISQKLSQNDRVSPKSVQKAYVSPYIPKRVRKVTS